MKNFKNKKTLQIVLLVAIAVLTLGIGYASITAINLLINGNATASVNQENFKVYFTQAQSITGSTGVSGTSSIDDNDATIAYFDVSGLTKVGDYGVATYTISNNSNGIGADISLQLTNSNNEYFKITETVADSQLQSGDTTSATIKVEIVKKTINNSVTTSITRTIKATPIENEQATGEDSLSMSEPGIPISFAADSWTTIKKAVQDNNTSLYNVGDTKQITIGDKSYKLRIVNKETGVHCGDEDTAYSQTACGLVIEFEDIIVKQMKMHDSSETNTGGYPTTNVHYYLNNTLYNQLPIDLQNAIKSTRVISGHGSTESQNYTSNDMLYLFSGVEIYGSDSLDSAASASWQLEYYRNNNVTESSYGDYTKKKYENESWWYWLRSPRNNWYTAFHTITNNGNMYGAGATDTGGVTAAFRIG